LLVLRQQVLLLQRGLHADVCLRPPSVSATLRLGGPGEENGEYDGGEAERGEQWWDERRVGEIHEASFQS
jgi:hypothetical protein